MKTSLLNENGISNPSCKISTTENGNLVLDTSQPVIEKVVSMEQITIHGKYSFQKITRVCTTFFARYQQLPFFKYRCSFLLLLIAITYAIPGFITGILWGFYLSLIAFLLLCVSDSLPAGAVTQEYCEELMQQIEEETKREDDRKLTYKGWMNFLSGSYRHHSFHINHVKPVLVELEENKLRILHPERTVLKHSFHIDPSLTETEPKIMAETVYDLVNATVKIRPRHLARRRWFSRRYPICIKFHIDPDSTSQNAATQVFRHSSTFENLSSLPKKILRKKSKSKTPDKKSENSDLVEYGREADIFLSDETDNSGDSDADDEFEIATRSMHSVSVENIAGDTLVRLHDLPSKKVRNDKCIYLFARSNREKEQWFHRLRWACSRFSTLSSFVEQEYAKHPEQISLQKRLRRTLSLPESIDDEPIPLKFTRDYFLYILHSMQFSRHLTDILGKHFSYEEEPATDIDGKIVSMDLGKNKWTIPTDNSSHELVIVANLIASRFFYDFCRDVYWCKVVQNKIQTKLATIHLPYFIETLELSNFNVGTAIPKILKIYKPTVDDWGIWIDFEIKYDGCIRLMLETRVNLLKIKDASSLQDSLSLDSGTQSIPLDNARLLPSRYFDDEVPESPESSPDEDFGSKIKLNEISTRKKTGKKILNWIDKISHSNLFKEFAEWKPVQNLMSEISSTRLILNVEITVLEGLMTINLPSPPSDRLWYGFRKPPKMCVKAVPQVGDRPVVLSTVSEWIENKLKLLLEKNLVTPNLDDVVVPVLAGNALLQGSLNK